MEFLLTFKHDSRFDQIVSLPNRADKAGTLQFLHKARVHKLLRLAVLRPRIALSNQTQRVFNSLCIDVGNFLEVSGRKKIVSRSQHLAIVNAAVPTQRADSQLSVCEKLRVPSI
jgi:hypothetical protein